MPEVVLFLITVVLFAGMCVLWTEPQTRTYNSPKEAFLDKLLEDYYKGKRFKDEYANIYCAMEVYISLCQYEIGIEAATPYQKKYCIRAFGVAYKLRKVDLMKTRKVKPVSPMGGVFYSGNVQIDPNTGRVLSIEKPPAKALQPTTGIFADIRFPWNRKKK